MVALAHTDANPRRHWASIALALLAGGLLFVGQGLPLAVGQAVERWSTDIIEPGTYLDKTPMERWMSLPFWSELVWQWGVVVFGAVLFAGSLGILRLRWLHVVTFASLALGGYLMPSMISQGLSPDNVYDFGQVIEREVIFSLAFGYGVVAWVIAAGYMLVVTRGHSTEGEGVATCDEDQD